MPKVWLQMYKNVLCCTFCCFCLFYSAICLEFSAWAGFNKCFLNTTDKNLNFKMLSWNSDILTSLHSRLHHLLQTSTNTGNDWNPKVDFPHAGDFEAEKNKTNKVVLKEHWL